MLQSLGQLYTNKLASMTNSFAGSLSNELQAKKGLNSDSAKDFNAKVNQYYQKAGQKINFLA